MSRKLQIVMHTHWDREWYFTKDETQVLLANHLKEVIEFLEGHSDCIYILDGQSVMIDDFLELAPDWERRMQRVIENNQLRVGPWYTQTDLRIVHGESIIRNLYYGMKRASLYGEPMRVGYAPDTFGHNHQMPQIYTLFGIESSFFWRGFSELKASKSDFIWVGADGSEIVGVNLATGYQGAKYLESDKEELTKRMQKIMRVLDHFSAGDGRLIMNGHDQMPIQRNIYDIIELLKAQYSEDSVEITDFESYVATLPREQLEKVSGELIDSKHARIHKTINSTRMDIKLLNSELEYKLFHQLEPLSLIGMRYGIEYPHALFEKCYKILFGVHAHDSIGGCNSDNVNRDILSRLFNVAELVDTQLELVKRLMTTAQTSDRAITIYNTLPYARNGDWIILEMQTRTSDFSVYDANGNAIDYTLLSQNSVDAGKIDRQVAARLLDIQVYESKIAFPVSKIQGLSVLTYTYDEGIGADTSVDKRKGDTIENTLYKIWVDQNGMHLFNKREGMAIENFMTIEQSGDAGDSYDYSPPENDWIINDVKAITDVLVQEERGYHALAFTLMMQLPANAVERENRQCTKEMKFDVKIALFEGDEKVHLSLKTTNVVCDSRFRLKFKTEIHSDVVESDMQLSSITRPVYNKTALSIWEQDNWVEKPVSIETFQSYVSLKDGKRQATLFANGHKEYEVFEDAMYLTLFRSFSHLGKRALINRPGRPSGIEVETPDNQLLDTTFSMHFALSFSKLEDAVGKISREYQAQLFGYQRKEFNRFNLNTPLLQVSEDNKYLDIDFGNCVVSAVKATENGEIFIRIFNPTNEEAYVKFDHNKVWISDMFEKKRGGIKEITIASQQIQMFIIE